MFSRAKLVAIMLGCYGWLPGGYGDSLVSRYSHIQFYTFHFSKCNVILAVQNTLLPSWGVMDVARVMLRVAKVF